MEAASRFPDPVETQTVARAESTAEYGKIALHGAAELETPQNGRYMYRRFDVSEQSSALERTDLSNPDQPFFDF